ncbi:MAG: response regulator [Candidatus Omnitrophica bacterium]|nr:response regulator [Candidatus Omnitrophota bacterium]
MDKKRVLIVDDEPKICGLYREFLISEGYYVSSCNDGNEAMIQLENEKFDIVLLDIQMPGMDGFTILSRIGDKGIPVVIITAFGTVENAVRALKSGASDFLVKPFSLEDLSLVIKRNIESNVGASEISRLKMIKAILELNRVIVSLTELDPLLDKIINIVNNIYQPELIAMYIAGEEGENFILRKYMPVKNKLPEQLPVSFKYTQVENIFSERKALIEKEKNYRVTIPLTGTKKEIGFMYIEVPLTKEISEEEIKFLEIFALQVGIAIENAILFNMIRNSYINSIKSLINSLEAKDAYTKGHSEQVAYYSLLIGKEMGIGSYNLEVLKNASYLHDLGKLGIKDSILLKPGPLDRDEMEIIKQHPSMTIKILEPLDLKKDVLAACLHHHERVNGNGYPSGLKGDEIPLLARILAIADAYSAMVSERPYRNAMTEEEAIAELRRHADMQFDRDIVDTFIKILKENKKEVKEDERN